MKKLPASMCRLTALPRRLPRFVGTSGSPSPGTDNLLTRITIENSTFNNKIHSQ